LRTPARLRRPFIKHGVTRAPRLAELNGLSAGGVLLGRYSIAATNQAHEHVEHLRLDLHRLAGPA
jgi:hypothetical protein